MPRMPKSSTSTPAASCERARRPATSTPKPSSPRKTLPMPATRTRPAPGGDSPSASGSTSSGEKKKRWPGCRGLPRSRAGVVLDASRASWTCPSIVLLDAPPRRRFCRPARCRRRRRRAGAQAHAAARGEARRPATVDRVRRRALQLLPGIAHGRLASQRPHRGTSRAGAAAPPRTATRCARVSRARSGRRRASPASPRR